MTKSKNKKDTIARRINAAISSAVFHIKPGADNYSIKIGNSLKPQQEIRENAEAAMKNLASVIPGGFQNIRAVNIKCEKSKPVPIYLSLSSGNDVPVPHVGPNASLPKPVQGELSTQPGKKVIVYPTGEVIVKKIKRGRNVSDSLSVSVRNFFFRIIENRTLRCLFIIPQLIRMTKSFVLTAR